MKLLNQPLSLRYILDCSLGFPPRRHSPSEPQFASTRAAAASPLDAHLAAMAEQVMLFLRYFLRTTSASSLAVEAV